MTNSPPLVCICIPTYNSEKTIGSTLESILNQTYSNFIVKISDNASTDRTLDIIRSYQDPRVSIFTSDKNIGGEGNFNRCIELSEGEYTAIFHSDDIYDPRMLQEQVSFMEKEPSAGAVFTEARVIDEADKRIGYIKLPKIATRESSSLYGFETLFKAVLKHSNFFICPSFMVRTSVYKHEVICWKGEEFKSSADLDVWLRILGKNKIGHIAKPLIHYRLGSLQGSSAIRKATEEADFFLVIKHYLSKKEVQEFLNKQDLLNYRDLVRRDNVMRAINLFLSGREHESGDVLGKVFSWEMLQRSYLSKRGGITLIGALYLKFILFFNLRKLGNSSLSTIKSRFNK